MQISKLLTGLALAIGLSAVTAYGCSATEGGSSDPDSAGDADATSVEAERPEVSERAAELQQELGLSEEQTEEVSEILAGTHTRMEELHERAREAKESGEGHEAMKEIKEEGRLLMEEQADRMRAVLDTEQFAAYEKMVAERHGMHGMHKKHCEHGDDCPHHGGKGMHGKKDPAAHAAKLQEKLGLSDEQAKQVEAVLVEFEPQRKEIHGKAKALHQEVKQLKQDGADEAAVEAKWAEMKTFKAEGKKLHDAQADRIKAVLNADQLRTYEELLAKHAEHKKHKGKHGKGEHH